jgi:hypothetical protein
LIVVNEADTLGPSSAYVLSFRECLVQRSIVPFNADMPNEALYFQFMLFSQTIDTMLYNEVQLIRIINNIVKGASIYIMFAIVCTIMEKIEKKYYIIFNALQSKRKIQYIMYKDVREDSKFGYKYTLCISVFELELTSLSFVYITYSQTWHSLQLIQVSYSVNLDV